MVHFRRVSTCGFWFRHYSQWNAAGSSRRREHRDDEAYGQADRREFGLRHGVKR